MFLGCNDPPGSIRLRFPFTRFIEEELRVKPTGRQSQSRTRAPGHVSEGRRVRYLERAASRGAARCSAEGSRD